MPSFTATPATLEIAGGAGTFIPARFSGIAARLYFTSGSASFTVGSGTGLSATVPNLDRLTVYDKFPGVEEAAWHRFVAIWQDMCEKIEEAFEGLTTQVTDNTTVIARLVAAEALASAANDNAAEAISRLNIGNSYPDPANVLTATNDGTISIAAHDRVYGDGSEVPVSAGTVTGNTPGTRYQVYYIDAGREGGAVTFQATTSNVAQEGNTHVIGSVTVPAVGDTAATGSTVGAPGAIDPELAAAYEKFNPAF